MKRRALVAVVVLLAPACMSGGGAETRTVFVDFSSDRYGSYSLYDFPNRIDVHPGTTLVFKQTWTGEPHTITTGTTIAKILASATRWLDLFTNYTAVQTSGADVIDPENAGNATVAQFFAKLDAVRDARDRVRRAEAAWDQLRADGAKLPDRKHPPNTPFANVAKYIDHEVEEAFAGLPSAFKEQGFDINQNLGQPCYLQTGGPPKVTTQACTKAQQRQPIFDGTQSFYSSGVIPYEGPQGNTYRVPLAKTIKPGTYTFFCAVHGPLQQVQVHIVDSGTKIASQSDVLREAQREIDEHNAPLDKVWADARDGVVKIRNGGRDYTIKAPYAGLYSPLEQHAAINAMVPVRLTVGAGQPITWKVLGADHTITFDVPKYFPPVQFLRDGTVRVNPKLVPPAGGAPTVPDHEGPDVQQVDGGTWNGRRFWSTGLIGACPECGGAPYIEYTLRITKPGTYRYACLLHPPMVGTVVVTP